MRCIALVLSIALLVAACAADEPTAERQVDTSQDAEEAAGPTEEPPADPADSGRPLPTSNGPDVDMHWHAAYGIFICDDFVDPFQDGSDPQGIHTHGDGLIHVHPFVAEAANQNATLGKFMEALSIELTDDGFINDNGSLEAGMECPGGPAQFKVARWQLFELDDGPIIIDSNIAATQFVEDFEIYTFGFAPAGTELPLPPWVSNLGSIGDIDPADLPQLPPGFAVAAVPAPGVGASIEGDTPCPAADGSSARTTEFTAAPPLCIDPDAAYTATFVTNYGDVVVELDVLSTPDTVNNFVVLARYHYYDGTSLFRTVPAIAIIQGGAPHLNSGSDPGPGYTIEDEGDGFTYVPGDLAMARAAAPNSSSAQFFFSSGPATANLDGEPGDPDGLGLGTYVVFGRTVQGFEVLEEIMSFHVDDAQLQGGGPGVPVIIETVRITEN